MSEASLSVDDVRRALSYDPETGEFIRIYSPQSRWSNMKPGRIQRHPSGHAYLEISLWRRRYQAHRLAWIYMTGEWPSKFIDHINGNGLDNRFSNLREATVRQNNQNSSTRRDNALGLKGVSVSGLKFTAKIKVDGKTKSLGTFITKEDAHAAYCRAAKEIHGEFARVA